MARQIAILSDFDGTITTTDVAEIILERFQSGDFEEQIAKDFNVKRIDVQRALQFELNRAA